MKVGIFLQGLGSLALNENVVRLSEGMKADSIWLPDHLLGVYHPGLWHDHAWSDFIESPDAWFDPFALIGRLSHQTGIPFGISVTDGVRRRAVDVARSALSLQHMCKGGFNLGVGSGEAESLRPFGYPFDRPVSRFEEFLSELRHLLDTGRALQEGCGRLGLPLESEAGPVKLWVGAHGPRMLRLAGQFADGWMPVWKMPPEQYAGMREVIRGHAQAKGRAMPECGLLAPIILGESRERILALYDADPVSKSFAVLAPAGAWERHGLEHPAGTDSQGLVDVIIHEFDPEQLREIAKKIPAELIAEFNFMGNAEELFEAFAPYARAGLEHIVLANVTGVAGGMREIEARMPELMKLRSLLAKL